jgi:hypothetical protein
MPSVFRGSDNFDTAGGNAVKAWVNFNGTGTVAIRASFNVSSITDNGTGEYTLNFTNALADANYALNVTGTTSQALACGLNDLAAAPAAANVRIVTRAISGVLADSPYVYAAIFR